MTRYLPLVAVLLASLAPPAHAHFVWVAVEKDSTGQPAAHVWFSELAEADSADLLDKIATVKVWSRSATGEPTELKVTRQVKDAVGALVAGVAPDTAGLSASIKYGVLERRGQVFLLNYYAKYLNAGAPAFKALARDEALPLDVVPHMADGGYTLEVTFQGKPVEGSEVVMLSPEGNETTLKADAAGKVKLVTKEPGLYSIRAKWTVNQAGKEGDKEYPQINNYCTLALRVPDAKAAPDAAEGAADASQLLERARVARASWQKFPGFEADVQAFYEGREQSGKIHVSADGQVSLSGLELKDDKPLLTSLRSLVSHRLPSADSADKGTFADDQADHPLGRLVKLDYDTGMASAYRIKDDVIREVNRQSPQGKFTITVFDVHRNVEGKYLPGYYTVSFWNPDGTLRSTSTTHETWTRVGDFDLPATHASVVTGANEHRNASLKFSNHKLLK